MSTQQQAGNPSSNKHSFNASNFPSRFTFYEDSGHGWLEVPFSLLKALGIEDKITGYSYQKGKMAYLEEDLDAVTFWNAYLEAIGRPKDYKYTHSLVTSQYSDSSIVRCYDHYNVPCK